MDLSNQTLHHAVCQSLFGRSFVHVNSCRFELTRNPTIERSRRLSKVALVNLLSLKEFSEPHSNVEFMK